MTTNTIQYGNTENTNVEPQQPAWFTAISKKIEGLLNRSQAEAAQAWFKVKRQRQAQSHQDIVNSLPLEEKLRLGMYRYMD